MINKDALYNDLAEAFIRYQHRLENPLTVPDKTMEEMIFHYQTDDIFHKKVQSIVSGVMHIIDKHDV